MLSRGSYARLGLFAVVLAAACGPNYRYVYEGEASFERCYALDFDTNAVSTDRTGCWQTWLANYTYGAGTDRVEYARARVTNPATLPGSAGRPSAATPGNLPVAATPPMTAAALAAATPQPPAPLVGALTRTAPPQPAVLAPPAAEATLGGRISAGGNPIAAPPITAPASTASTQGPPGHACASDCTTSWSACGGQCATGGPACVARCDEHFRDCVRGCY